MHSISLLDENNDNIINSSISNNFGKIFVWRDNNTDGILNTGEFTALENDASINLNNTSSSDQGPAGSSAYILQTAEIDLGASGGRRKRSI